MGVGARLDRLLLQLGRSDWWRRHHTEPLFVSGSCLYKCTSLIGILQRLTGSEERRLAGLIAPPREYTHQRGKELLERVQCHLQVLPLYPWTGQVLLLAVTGASVECSLS